MKPRYTIIAAVDCAGGIGTVGSGAGAGGSIPWKCSADLRHFARETRGGVVIMGRGTWASLDGTPLAARLNIVITRTRGFEEQASTFYENVMYATSFENALEIAERNLVFHPKGIYVIGGAAIYAAAAAAAAPAIPPMVLTRITRLDRPEADFGCNRFFPRALLDAATAATAAAPVLLESGVEAENGVSYRIERVCG